MSVRALTFDVVGTLIDFETGILRCVESVAPGLDPAGVLAAYAAAEDAQQRATPERALSPMLDPISERLARDLGVPALAGTPSPLRLSAPYWPAFDDAAEALRMLGKRYRLVAVTNADRAALASMAVTLGDPFDDTVTVDDVGVNKPDPRMFRAGLDRLAAHGIAPSEVLHVAQSQYHDIGAAQRLGLATCWVERRRGQHGFGATPAPPAVVAPDRHVGSMAELAAAL